jgi:hypothetical protein
MAKAQTQDQPSETSSESSSEGQVQKKIVKITSAFEYRGADFAPGKYYEVDDVPANFVDWHIVRNKKGSVVDKAPQGAEVLPDPRPAAQEYRDKADAERERQIVAQQQPRTRGEEPSARQVEQNEAGRAETFTSTENIYGGTHGSDGTSGPGVPLGGEQRHTGGSEEEKASLTEEQKEGVPQPKTGDAQPSQRPRVPRT